MVLPPNRIGGIRGGDGTTLDDLLAALGNISNELAIMTAAIEENTAAVLQLRDSQGTPEMTDCGLTTTELLCGIYTLLGGDGTAVGPPPAACPGFPENPTEWYYAATWYLPETELTGLTGNAAPNWAANGVLNHVTIADYYPVPGDDVYRLHKITTDIDLTNICVAWEGKEAGYGFIANVYWVADDSIAFSTPLGTQADTGTGSDSFILSANQYAHIQASVAGGTVDTPPDVTIWLSEGAIG